MPRLISQALALAGITGAKASTGVDVIGDIAIVRLSGFGERQKKKVGEALLKEIGNVRSVYEQEGGIEGEFRLRKVNHLAGKKETLTTHKENGCMFKVDVAKCYFSPRLSTERMRIANEVGPHEKVLNMFAGVGPFSVPIAKISGAEVVSCEVNRLACRLHVENDLLNKVEGLVTVLFGDAEDLPRKTNIRFDRVIMPHPSQADKFFPAALEMTKRRGLIHYYRHVLGRDGAEASSNLRDELKQLVPQKARFSVRRVREVGPRWIEMVADIRLPN